MVFVCVKSLGCAHLLKRRKSNTLQSLFLCLLRVTKEITNQSKEPIIKAYKGEVCPLYIGIKSPYRSIELGIMVSRLHTEGFER